MAQKKDFHSAYAATARLSKANYGYLIDPNGTEGSPDHGSGLSYDLWRQVLSYVNNEDASQCICPKDLLNFARVNRMLRFMIERESSHFVVQLNIKAFKYFNARYSNPQRQAREKFCQALGNLEHDKLPDLIRQLDDAPLFDFTSISSSSDKTLVLTYTMVSALRYRLDAKRLTDFSQTLDVLIANKFLDLASEPLVFYAVQLNVNKIEQRIELLNQILKRKPSLDAGSQLSGLSPLHLAVKKREAETADWLLQNGADPINNRMRRTFGTGFDIGSSAKDSLVALLRTDEIQGNSKQHEQLKAVAEVFKKHNVDLF